MNIIDIIILVLLTPSIILGIKKGFISQITSLLSIILGIFLAGKLTEVVGKWLIQYISVSPALLNLISFALIFIVVCIALALLAKLLEKAVKVVLLGWVNRLLGALFSLLTFLVVFSLVVALLNGLNNHFNFLNNAAFAESVLYGFLEKVSSLLMPYLKDLWDTTTPALQQFSA